MDIGEQIFGRVAGWLRRRKASEVLQSTVVLETELAAVYLFSQATPRGALILAGGAMASVSPEVIRLPSHTAQFDSLEINRFLLLHKALAAAKKATGKVDGFVVENKTAGGHNAPPRGLLQIASDGQPVYGPKDEADLAAIRELDRPFWLAGSYGHPQKLNEALALGATGIQAGAIFALSEESGFGRVFKKALIENVAGLKETRVFTDPHASPSGFPFKVADLENTLANPRVYEGRNRVCDLGYLRMPFMKTDGTLGYRCPSEPQAAYVHKGGNLEDTVSRKCLCNGLMAAAGLAQIQKGGTIEPALITAGDDIEIVNNLSSGAGYSVEDVMKYLRGR